MSGWFVTGTDTGVGKTWVSCALLQGLRARGFSALGMKPVASGAHPAPGGPRSADALLLLEHSSEILPYDTINPVLFAEPVAPHIAAEQTGTRIDIAALAAAYRALHARADAVIVEGVGGWRVPLGTGTGTAALVRAMGIPVILVVGYRLGCLNHALLSTEAIHRDGIPLAGWVANHAAASYATTEATSRYLRGALDAPCLGEIPRRQTLNAAELASYLQTEILLAR